MNVKELIQQSESYLLTFPVFMDKPVSLSVFKNGGRWMQTWLEILDGETKTAQQKIINFSLYGFIKYAISILALIISALLLSKISFYLIPLSIVVFYIAEVHFLFLFPLLIDQVKNPINQSIRITYHIGLFKVLIMVIPIGFYMLAGLLTISDPFRNWYKGCLAILIWYRHDVRNRV